MPDFRIPNFSDFGFAQWFGLPAVSPKASPTPSPTPTPYQNFNTPGFRIDPNTNQVVPAPSNDVVSAAMQQTFNPSNTSFFPAANQRLFAQSSVQANQDLANQIDGTFYGGGSGPQPTPTPTATPSSVKPTQMTLTQLYDHFGVPNPIGQRNNYSNPLYYNKPDNQVYDWRKNSGEYYG